MLELRELTRFYGALPAIRGVNASLRPGDVLGLLGPERLRQVDDGEDARRPAGADLREDPVGRRRRLAPTSPRSRRASATCPKRRTSTRSSRRRNISSSSAGCAGSTDATLARRIDEFLRLFNLESARYQPITACSKGMRQKVLISAALLHDPDILVLDEPCSGLDVSTTMALREMIQRLSAMGKIVVYSSHVMDMVEKVSTRVLIVHRGRVVADNSVSALRDLLSLPSLEAVFAELTVEEDVASTANQLVDGDAGLNDGSRQIPPSRAVVLAPVLRERPARSRHRPAAVGDLAAARAGGAGIPLDGQAGGAVQPDERPRLQTGRGRVVAGQVAADGAGNGGRRRRHGARVGSAARGPARRVACWGAFQSSREWSWPPRHWPS